MAGAKDRYGQLLQVKLYSQFHVYFNGGASSVSGTNRTGAFDILPGHANFFTLLGAGAVQIVSGGEPFEFKVNRGIVWVSGNQVKVFVDL